MRFLALLAILLTAQAPPPPSSDARIAWGFDRSDLPPDPRIRFGVLANGMRYAIQPNSTPARGVAIRMLVRVGAADGAPAEAHYLEHMAFMGSGRVHEGARERLRRREHLRLGRDFNARTGDTDTYYSLDLPRPGGNQVRRILLLLRDMAGNLTLAPDAVERARGEIVAEARQRSGGEDARERDQIAFFVPGTRIARTTLTGSEAEAGAVGVEGLRRLYETYYAPGRTTLIVVGAVDPSAIEATISATFSDWPARQAPPSPPPDRIDPERPTAFRAFTAPGSAAWATIASISPRAAADATAPRDLGFLQSLAADMLAARVTGHRGDDRPFMDAEAVVGDYYRTARIARFSIHAFDGDWRTALAVAEQELRCALRNGFTEDELAIAREREVERLAAFAGPETSAAIADRLTQMAGLGIVPTVPGTAADNAVYLARIRLDDLDAAFRAAWSAPGRLVHVADSRAIEGGEAELARVWAAGAPCPAQ
ncbi:MAG TPA: insulinase family protein [Allosphingosinicella sp.]|nr:insulinase family protein [Allosphingosinicella sp.]